MHGSAPARKGVDKRLQLSKNVFTHGSFPLGYGVFVCNHDVGTGPPFLHKGDVVSLDVRHHKVVALSLEHSGLEDRIVPV